MRYYINFILIILGLVFLNKLVGHFLFRVSIDMMLKMIEEGRNEALLYYFERLKLLASKSVLLMIPVILFIFESKALAFHYTLITSLSMFCLIFLKMIIREPRPYQYDSSIEPSSCSSQYGCPSGHSIRVTAAFLSLYLDFIFSRRNKIDSIIFGIATLTVITLLVLSWYSRFYLLAHTFNQIIFGAAIGILIAFFMHFYIKI